LKFTTSNSGDRQTYIGNLTYWIDEAKDGLPKHYQEDAIPIGLKFFDLVIGNEDRNSGNYMHLPNNRIVAIDHDDTLNHYHPIPIDKRLSIFSSEKKRLLNEQYMKWQQIKSILFTKGNSQEIDSNLWKNFDNNRRSIIDKWN